MEPTLDTCGLHHVGTNRMVILDLYRRAQERPPDEALVDVLAREIGDGLKSARGDAFLDLCALRGAPTGPYLRETVATLTPLLYLERWLDVRRAYVTEWSPTPPVFPEPDWDVIDAQLAATWLKQNPTQRELLPPKIQRVVEKLVWVFGSDAPYTGKIVEDRPEIGCSVVASRGPGHLRILPWEVFRVSPRTASSLTYPAPLED